MGTRLIPGLTMKQSAALMKRSLSLYGSMRTRLKKLDLGDIRFTLEEFRSLMKDSIDKMCPYCRREKMKVALLSADHAIPLSRTGSADLNNLVFCCMSCNTAKHEMTKAEYLTLLECLDGFEASVRNKIIGRLKAGASIQRLRFLKR